VRSVRAETLRRAAEIAGSEEALALLIRVTPSHLALWLEGVSDVPDGVFLRAVDIVLAHKVVPSPCEDEAVKPGNGALR
jgi:hypothetical protein